jgi:hypothetical protein
MNSTYKKVKQPEVYWIVRDGQVGTAHIGRSGRWVDFRPARSVQVYVSSYALRYVVRITYYPAKGVEAEEISVYYRRAIAVDYRTDTVTATEPDNPFAEGEPEKVVTVKYEFGQLRELPGFPIPEDILREREAERERIYRELEERESRIQEVKKTIASWAEKLTGQERRWMHRYLNFGKAEEQVKKAALTAFPNFNQRDVLEALHALRCEWQKD